MKKEKIKYFYQAYKIGRDALNEAEGKKLRNAYGEFIIRWNNTSKEELDALAKTIIDDSEIKIGLMITNENWEFFENSKDKIPQKLQDILEQTNLRLIPTFQHWGIYFKDLNEKEFEKEFKRQTKDYSDKKMEELIKFLERESKRVIKLG